jgi:hypothetical protein
MGRLRPLLQACVTKPELYPEPTALLQVLALPFTREPQPATPNEEGGPRPEGRSSLTETSRVRRSPSGARHYLLFQMAFSFDPCPITSRVSRSMTLTLWLHGGGGCWG